MGKMGIPDPMRRWGTVTAQRYISQDICNSPVQGTHAAHQDKGGRAPRSIRVGSNLQFVFEAEFDVAQRGESWLKSGSASSSPRMNILVDEAKSRKRMQSRLSFSI